MNFTKTIVLVFLLAITIVSDTLAQKKQVLLIGTFHFHNPGQDMVKQNSFDVLSAKSQQGLELMAAQIKKFHPTQIFVEWDYREQRFIDSLYQAYRAGTYDGYIKTRFKKKATQDNFTKNEIAQLAFRAAKKTGLDSVTCFDYKMGIPFDTVMKVIKNAGQTTLLNDMNNSMADMARQMNDKIAKLTLLQLIEDMNTPASRRENNGIYIKLLNRAGTENNFAGADAVDSWYKRNLYMYSIIQKRTSPKDERIMVLAGSGHISMIEKFIKDEAIYQIVELKDVMKLK